MTTDLALFSKIISMPPSLKEEALKYVNYLLSSQGLGEMPAQEVKIPKAGFSTVDFVMSADFDAPLADFKEYME
jgi:hypothetical protein